MENSQIHKQHTRNRQNRIRGLSSVCSRKLVLTYLLTYVHTAAAVNKEERRKKSKVEAKNV